MKRILIEEQQNGWLVRMEGFSKVQGGYVYNGTEILRMIEIIGENVNGRKVYVEER